MVVVDADERDARQIRGHPRVMAAQMPDADDGETHRGEAHRIRTDRRRSTRHLMKPRSLDLMNRTSSSTSGWPGSSSAIRSRAWLVLSLDLTRIR